MDGTRWLDTLNRDPWFASLRPELVELMLSLAIERRYAAHEIVYSANDPSTGLFCVLSGGVRLSQNTESGKHILFSTFSPGTWFGVISEFDGLPRPHTAIAVAPTQLLQISGSAFREIVSRDWRNCFDLARSVVVLFRNALERLSALRAQPYPARVAQALLAMSDHEAGSGGDEGSPRVTQDDLAAIVGVTRQTINRLLNAWESEGLLRRRYGRIALLEPARLAAIAAAES